MFSTFHRFQARTKVACTVTEARYRGTEISRSPKDIVQARARHYKSCMYAPERKVCRAGNCIREAGGCANGRLLYASLFR